ncbi:MAG TPA: hypothetical protein VIQ74_04950 [Gemmatimonadaceae bacterium]
MPFKIEITEVTERGTIQREWKKIADSGNKADNGPVYGYAEFPGIEKVTREVLKQEVGTLDLGAVIRAVNNL